MSMISGNATRPIKVLKSALTSAPQSFTVGSGEYNNSTTVTHASSSEIQLGMTVTSSKSGIPANAYVNKINSATSFELSVGTTGGAQTGCTLTFNYGYVNAIKEVGTHAGDVVEVSGANETAAYTAMHDIIHAAGTSNPFLSGDPAQAPSAPINLLTGCKVYKRTDTGSGTIEYWRTFLLQKDSHGLVVGTGSSVANLVGSDSALANYEFHGSVTLNAFNEPIEVISQPTIECMRFDLGKTRKGFSTIASNTLGSFQACTLHGLFDLFVQDKYNTTPVGEKFVMPAGLNGSVTDIATLNFWMYYVLDEDNIVLYTDRVDGGGGSSPAFARLKDNSAKTWLGFGRSGDIQTGVDAFLSPQATNPTSMEITNSVSEPQIVPGEIMGCEFYAAGGDTTIELGYYTAFIDPSSFSDNEPIFNTSSPTILVPAKTKVFVYINPHMFGCFRATSSAANDTLYWNYMG